jgi:hypothetical protein
MRPRVLFLFSIGTLLILPRISAAAEAVGTEDMSPVRAAAVLLCPLLVLLVPLLALLVWAILRMNRNQGYMVRAEQHMQRLEQQNERIIALLEAIAQRPPADEAAQSVQARRPGSPL